VTRATRESECVPQLRIVRHACYSILVFSISLRYVYIHGHIEMCTRAHARAHTPLSPRSFCIALCVPLPPFSVLSRFLLPLYACTSLSSPIALSASFPPHSDSLVDSRIRRATRISPGLFKIRPKGYVPSELWKFHIPSLFFPSLLLLLTLCSYFLFIFFVFVRITMTLMIVTRERIIKAVI